MHDDTQRTIAPNENVRNAQNALNVQNVFKLTVNDRKCYQYYKR